jgi:predicted kinase
MVSYLHARFPPLRETDLSEVTLSLREEILNQRLIDAHYAIIKATNAREYKRLTGVN